MQNTDDQNHQKDFSLRAEEKRAGFLKEIAIFLRDTRKWWLTPILIALLLATALILLGGTAAAPFIYTLF